MNPYKARSLFYISSLSAYPGVPHAGGVTIWNMLSSFSKHHEVSLVAFEKPTDIPNRGIIRKTIRHHKTVPAFRGWASRLIRLPLLLVMPLDMVSVLSLSFFLECRRAFRNHTPEIVQAEYSSMGIYLLGIASNCVTVLNLHDVQTDALRQSHCRAKGVKRLYLRWQCILTEWWEKRICNKVTLVLVWSEKDREFLSHRLGISGSKIRVFSPYVDFSMGNIPTDESDGRTVLFVGAMYREVNQEGCEWFLEKIWPRIKAKHPGAVFHIVGGNPPGHFVDRWSRKEDVHITGYVPDLSLEYRRATVVVVPLLRAGGIIVKMLDAFVAGRPVVATTIANSGILAQETDIRIADDPEIFADHVNSLLDSPELRRESGLRGREFVRRKYRWEKTMKDLEIAYEEALHRRAGLPEV